MLAGDSGFPGPRCLRPDDILKNVRYPSSAQFNRPWGVAVDPSGNLYVADSGNNVIRKITSAGSVTTVAGLAGFAGNLDGTGTNARLNGPVGIAIDGSGNLLVSETSNTLRIITPAAVVSTIAGAAGVAGSLNGNGSLARFNFPASLAVDGNENLFIADSLNSTVRFAGFISLPVISAQSPNQSASTGAGVTLSVTASASPTIAYQWLFNGSVVPGATSASLSIANLQAVNTGSYNVIISDYFTNSLGTVLVGSITSPPITVSIVAPPTFLSQPASQTVLSGLAASFSVMATGSPPPTYQWLFNGSPIAGATSSSYIISAAASANSGSYSVVATNGSGSVTSSVATLNVTPATPPPVAAVTPVNVLPPLSGVTATSVTTDQNGNIYYFLSSGSAIQSPLGGTAVLVSNPATVAQDRSLGTSLSNHLSLTDGAGNVYTVGGTNTYDSWGNYYASIYRTTPGGSPQVFYTIPYINNGRIAYGIAGMAFDSSGNIDVIEVYDLTIGSANGSSLVFVKINPSGTATLLLSSTNQGIDGGGSTIVVNDANGNFFVNLEGGLVKIDPTGAVTDLASAGALYNAQVALAEDSLGRIYSSDGRVFLATGQSAPAIAVAPTVFSVQPVSGTLAVGGAVPLSVAVSGFGPISLQWFRNGVAIAGANTTSYSATQPGTYAVNATTVTGTVASMNAVVAYVATTITTQPQSAILGFGGTVLLSVTATGAQLTYQWQLNNQNISSATSSSFTASAVGSYTVIVTGAGGVVTSQPAVISVATSGPVVSASQSAIPFGGFVTLTAVQANAVSYQWSLNGSKISGATTNNLVAAVPGSYTVTVVGASGSSVTSAPLNLGLANTPPFVTVSQPAIPYGGGSTLTAVLGGASAYQWQLNGTNIVGATGSAYTATAPGYYSVVVTSQYGYSIVSAATSLAFANRVINLSTRAVAASGSAAEFAGFVISGPSNSPKQLLIRGIGPALGGFGVSGFAIHATLTVFDAGGNVIATNSGGWSNNANANLIAATAQSVGAFALAPGSGDAALLLSLPPGAYSAQVSDADVGGGVALVEVYEADSSANRLINISTRASVGSGNNVEIAGFVVSGSTPVTLLIRADGPALTAFGVPNALPAPALSVYNANGNLVASNVGWSANSNAAQIVAEASAVGAFPLVPGSPDSALVLTLPPGAYTAVVSSQDGEPGIALVEVYQGP